MGHTDAGERNRNSGFTFGAERTRGIPAIWGFPYRSPALKPARVGHTVAEGPYSASLRTPRECVPRMHGVQRRRSYRLASLRMSASAPRAGAMLETVAKVRTGGPER